ncbi:MAG: arylesterase [Deltaproteobacteria bacterium]|nr:arylesterase [Deltaproteobacteria bacterium]
MKMRLRKNVVKILILGVLLWTGSAAAETRILFLGDSITAGLGVEKEQAYPHLVGKALRLKGYEDVTIINAGISGSTTASALSRLQWHTRMRPDILVLALGANDGLRGLSTREMKTNLDATIQYALDQGIKVILAGMELPPNYGAEFARAFRAVFKDLAQKHPIGFMPFLLKDVGGVARLNQPDGIHPNPDGHEIIARNILTHILENL